MIPAYAASAMDGVVSSTPSAAAAASRVCAADACALQWASSLAVGSSPL